MSETTTRWVVAADAQGRSTAAKCVHLDTIRAVIPSTLHGCEDCLREGSRWVPRRHAAAHWRAIGRPLVRSFEPGEDWAWCYADELFLLPS